MLSVGEFLIWRVNDRGYGGEVDDDDDGRSVGCLKFDTFYSCAASSILHSS